VTISEFVNKVGFKVKDEDVKKVNDSMQGIKNTATKLLGAIGIGFSLAGINGLVEEFGRVNNQIKSSVSALEDQEAVQQKILASANKTRSSYADSAKVIASLVKGNKELFADVDEAAKFNNAATMLFKTAGKTNEEIAGLMEAINKSFQKGYVDSETISQLLERSPEAVELLNKQLGTTSSQLEELASSGAMSVADLKAAFVDNAETIEKDFANVDMTISEALLHIRNQWGLWLAQTDKTLGITKTIAKAMTSAFNSVIAVLNRVRTALVWVSEKVGGAENLLKLLAIAAASIYVALNAGKIMSFLKSMGSLLGKVRLKTVAIIAVIILVALLIEDLFNFISGNNSLIGELLGKAGVDVEEFRSTLKGLWDQIKGLIPIFVQFGKTIGTMLLQALAKILPLLMQLIAAILPVLCELITEIIGFIVEIASSVLPLLLDLFMQIIEAVLPVIIDLIAAIIPLLIQIIQAILPVVIKLVQTILPLLLQIIQSILPVVIKLITTILPLLMQIIQAILPVVIDLINAILPLLLQIIEGILPVVIELINTILPILIEIINAVLPVIIELISAILPLLFQIIQAILPIIIELINTILPILMEIINAVLPVIIQLVQAILPLLMTIIDAVLPVIITLIQAILPVLQPIFDLLSSLISAILPVVISLFNAIIPIIQTITKVLGPVFDIIGLIVNAIAKVVGWIADGLGWVVDLFFGGGGDSSKAKDVAAYAEGTEHSEDTFIAGEEGPELITKAGGRKVFTALETGNIFKAMALLSRAATAQPGTVTNSTSSRVVNQYNEFVNTFHGERAVQKQAAAAFNTNAEDATAVLARGLAFAK